MSTADTPICPGPRGGSPDGGPGLDFDFPILTYDATPAVYRDAAVTNLFYWNNVMHDVSFRYGFDEQAGNFQQTNHSGLGLGEERAAMLHTDDGLMEIAHGTWEGLLAREIHERDPDRLRAWRDAPHEVLMPGGESLQHVLDRAWPALERACAGLDADGTLHPMQQAFLDAQAFQCGFCAFRLKPEAVSGEINNVFSLMPGKIKLLTEHSQCIGLVL